MNRLAVLFPRGVVAAVAVVGVLVALPATSHAITISADKYCSAGSDDEIVGDTILDSDLSLGDVTLTINGAAPQYTASECYGEFSTDNANAVTETSALNDIFAISGGPLVHLDGTGQDPSPTGIGGITFVVSIASGGVDGAPGTWTIAWADSNGAAPNNLPLYVDLVVLLVGGKTDAAYLLSSVLLPAGPYSGSGTFDIEFVNKGGQQPGISHLTLAGRVGSPPRLRQIPEPASIGMFGAGLLGVWLISRRRSPRRSS